MAPTRSAKRRPNVRRSPSSLIVRLDKASKKILARAAQLRHISVRDYVRQVTVAQARREVIAETQQLIALTAEEQLVFWKALNEPVKLTEAQKRLGALMRGEGE